MRKKFFDILSNVFLIACIMSTIYMFFIYMRVTSDDMVVALQNEVDYPIYTGSNVFEYWKSTLTDEQKVLYEEIKESYLQFKEQFGTKVKKINDEDFDKVFDAVVLDHPEIFWIDSYSTIITLNNYINTSKIIQLRYSYTKEEAKEVKARIEPKYNEIIEEAKKRSTDYDKIKYVHDKLIEISQYHEYTPDQVNSYQSIVSIFDMGDTVCAGYAYGFKFIMDNLGIKAIASSDVSHEEDQSRNHIWNMVNLDGRWYNIDVTWDQNNGNGIIYNYFLKDNDEFYKDHIMQEGIPQT